MPFVCAFSHTLQSVRHWYKSALVTIVFIP